jgi:hypothetical protein
MNPHGAAGGMSPHGGGIPPAQGTSIPMTPSHGSGGTDRAKDAK